MSKTLYFVEVATAGGKTRIAMVRRDGPFRDAATAEQYALRVHEQPYITRVTVIPQTLDEAVRFYVRADNSDQIALVRAAYRESFEERALTALTGPEFARYDAAHGGYDKEIYFRALRGDAWAMRQMYASVRALANGIEPFARDGATYSARKQAAVDVLAVWDSAS